MLRSSGSAVAFLACHSRRESASHLSAYRALLRWVEVLPLQGIGRFKDVAPEMVFASGSVTALRMRKADSLRE